MSKGLTKQYSHRYRADASPGQGSRDDDDEMARARRRRGGGTTSAVRGTGTKGNSSVDQPGCSTAVRTTSEEKRLPTTSQVGEPAVSTGQRATVHAPLTPTQDDPQRSSGEPTRHHMEGGHIAMISNTSFIRIMVPINNHCAGSGQAMNGGRESATTLYICGTAIATPIAHYVYFYQNSMPAPP